MSRDRMRRWSEVAWPFVRERCDDLVAVLPAGSVEQHGPHLPLATDVRIPVGLTDRLAACVSAPLGERLIMLPPLYYTYARHSNWWPGTLNLTGDTLIRLVRDVSCETFRNGISRLVLINGHMESVQFMEEGLREALDDYPGRSAMLVNWWDLVPTEIIERVFGDAWPGWEREHAALTETSLMLALCPDEVQTDALPDEDAVRDVPYTVLPEPTGSLPPSGVFADCTGADADTGELILEEIMQQMGGALRDFVGEG